MRHRLLKQTLTSKSATWHSWNRQQLPCDKGLRSGSRSTECLSEHLKIEASLKVFLVFCSVTLMNDIYLLVWQKQAQRVQHHVLLLHDSALHLFQAVKQKTLFVLQTRSVVSQNSVEQHQKRATAWMCSKWVYRVKTTHSQCHVKSIGPLFLGSRWQTKNNVTKCEIAAAILNSLNVSVFNA